MIILEPLEKALEQLRQGLDDAEKNPQNDLMRDGVIQRFEFTMDICWKMIQRSLKEVFMVDENAILTKHDLFREAANVSLITDTERWFTHYKNRCATSHTYNKSQADAIYNGVRGFYDDAVKLLEELRKYA